MLIRTGSAAQVPPGPRGFQLYRQLLRYRKDPLGFLVWLSEEFEEDILFFQVGWHKVFFLRHPDAIRGILVTEQEHFRKGLSFQWAKRFLGDGLITSEGGLHRRQRRLAQPAFHRDRLKAYGNTMLELTRRMSDTWKDGDTRDIAVEMRQLSCQIVGKTLLDIDLEGEADKAAEWQSNILELFEVFYRFTTPLGPLLDRLPLPSTRQFQGALAHLDSLVERIIALRRDDPRDRGDLLSMLLLAYEEETGALMSNKQLRDEALTILLSGLETTANAVTWAMYLISEHPGVEACLHEELTRVLSGRWPSVDDVAHLAYTRAVFVEAMRLYPPVFGLGRQALRPVRCQGYEIPPKASVVMSSFITHRDARFFSEPLVFRPARWLESPTHARPEYAYFPFGGGARRCIGEQFAWMEGVLILAGLVQEWRLSLVPGHPVAHQAVVTLRPRFGMPMRLQKRSPSPRKPDGAPALVRERIGN